MMNPASILRRRLTDQGNQLPVIYITATTARPTVRGQWSREYRLPDQGPVCPPSVHSHRTHWKECAPRLSNQQLNSIHRLMSSMSPARMFCAGAPFVDSGELTAWQRTS